MFITEDWDLGGLVVFLLVVAVLMVAAVAVVGWFATRMLAGGERPGRPWWGNPLLWLGVSGVFLVLGLFVFPHLLGGVFLFLPFLWFRGLRRDEPPPRACASCGRRLAPDHAYCPSCGTPAG